MVTKGDSGSTERTSFRPSLSGACLSGSWLIYFLFFSGPEGGDLWTHKRGLPNVSPCKIDSADEIPPSRTILFVFLFHFSSFAPILVVVAVAREDSLGSEVERSQRAKVGGGGGRPAYKRGTTFP